MRLVTSDGPPLLPLDHPAYTKGGWAYLTALHTAFPTVLGPIYLSLGTACGATDCLFQAFLQRGAPPGLELSEWSRRHFRIHVLGIRSKKEYTRRRRIDHTPVEVSPMEPPTATVSPMEPPTALVSPMQPQAIYAPPPLVIPESPALVWSWSMPPYAQITPNTMLDKIAKAQTRVLISTTAFTLPQVIEALKRSQAAEKIVLVGRHDFRRYKTGPLATLTALCESHGMRVARDWGGLFLVGAYRRGPGNYNINLVVADQEVVWFGPAITQSTAHCFELSLALAGMPWAADYLVNVFRAWLQKLKAKRLEDFETCAACKALVVGEEFRREQINGLHVVRCLYCIENRKLP